MKLPATGGTACLMIPLFLDMLQCCIWPVVCLSVYCSLCPRLWCRVSFQERSVYLSLQEYTAKFVQHGRVNWIKTVACQMCALHLPADRRFHTGKTLRHKFVIWIKSGSWQFSFRIGTGKLRMSSSQSVVTLPDIPHTFSSSVVIQVHRQPSVRKLIFTHHWVIILIHCSSVLHFSSYFTTNSCSLCDMISLYIIWGFYVTKLTPNNPFKYDVSALIKVAWTSFKGWALRVTRKHQTHLWG